MKVNTTKGLPYGDSATVFLADGDEEYFVEFTVNGRAVTVWLDCYHLVVSCRDAAMTIIPVAQNRIEIEVTR